jgi:hypothetical protein
MPTTNRPDHIPSRAKVLTERDRKAKLRRVMLTTWYGFHLDGLSVRDIAELVGASPAKVHAGLTEFRGYLVSLDSEAAAEATERVDLFSEICERT